jgi:hypothetical protein
MASARNEKEVVSDGNVDHGSDGRRCMGGLADCVACVGSDGRRTLMDGARDGRRDVEMLGNGTPVLGASDEGGTAGNRRTADEGRSAAGILADCVGIGGRGTLGGDVGGREMAGIDGVVEPCRMPRGRGFLCWMTADLTCGLPGDSG